MKIQGSTFEIDIVMCVDATASMAPHIERVKQNALRLHDDIVKLCKERGKIVQKLRVRVIAYRDYYVDFEPMMVSTFFELPIERDKFERFVIRLEADGGGDEPESGLEALAMAMKSDWSSGGQDHRHVIVVFTDASTHGLEKSPKPKSYPTNMPTNMHELSELWMGENPIMKREDKRLIIFAPDIPPWAQISSTWDKVVHHPAQAASGLANKDYHTIISIVVDAI